MNQPKTPNIKLSKRQKELLYCMKIMNAWGNGNDFGRNSCHCNHTTFDWRTLHALVAKKLAAPVRGVKGWIYEITDKGREVIS